MAAVEADTHSVQLALLDSGLGLETLLMVDTRNP